MSSIPASDVFRPKTFPTSLSPIQAAGVSSLLAVVGLSTIWNTVLALQDLWMHDDLKSIGMIIPVVSFLLILRAWRALGWEQDGSWWGLGVLVGTVAAVHLRDHTIMTFVVGPQWYIYLPPHSVVAFAYGSGVVLLFGGTRLYRAALFPVFLLLLVNPVPHFFNTLVDLPLQHASAHVARSFAIALGQPLTPDQLRLMFTPEFGIFIAPGCNGIRGAVTMGLIALVAGYVYRFRLLSHTLFVLAAVLLGYAFNFVRLCTLVLYYILALHVKWLQNQGKMADYYIGAVLFFIGTMLLVEAMRRLRQTSSLVLPPPPAAAYAVTPRSFYARLGAMLALALFGVIPMARGAMSPHPPAASEMDAVVHPLPERIGAYHLTRSWNDSLSNGIIIYQWGSYATEQGGTPVSIGISPHLGAHDALICHTARGEDPLWHGELRVAATGGESIPFAASFFNNGATQTLEAATLCNGNSCGEFSSSLPHFGFVYSKPDPGLLFQQNAQRSIPILIRAELLDATMAPGPARKQLTDAVAAFVASADLNAFTRPYRQ
jgi:exosortase J